MLQRARCIDITKKAAASKGAFLLPACCLEEGLSRQPSCNFQHKFLSSHCQVAVDTWPLLSPSASCTVLTHIEHAHIMTGLSLVMCLWTAATTHTYSSSPSNVQLLAAPTAAAAAAVFCPTACLQHVRCWQQRGGAHAMPCAMPCMRGETYATAHRHDSACGSRQQPNTLHDMHASDSASNANCRVCSTCALSHTHTHIVGSCTLVLVQIGVSCYRA